MKIFKNRAFYIGYVMGMFLFVGVAFQVEAIPILTFDIGADGTNELTVTDQDFGDIGLDPGDVQFNGTVGSFNVSVGGIADHSFAAGVPALNLGGFVTPIANDKIRIAINETGFSAVNVKDYVNKMYGMITSLNTTTMVQYDFLVGSDNDQDWSDDISMSKLFAPDPGGMFGSKGHNGEDIFDFSGISGMIGDAYALTIVATVDNAIDSPGGFAFANVQLAASITAVPEPATVALIGIGMVGLCGGAYVSLRRSKRGVSQT